MCCACAYTPPPPIGLLSSVSSPLGNVRHHSTFLPNRTSPPLALNSSVQQPNRTSQHLTALPPPLLHVVVAAFHEQAVALSETMVQIVNDYISYVRPLCCTPESDGVRTCLEATLFVRPATGAPPPLPPCQQLSVPSSSPSPSRPALNVLATQA